MPTFAARLNRLFDTVYPPGRGPYSGAEAVTALAEAGVKMSAPYLSQLRSGNRTNPSASTMAALAKFFGVKPDYFTEDHYYRELEKELTWLEISRDESIRRIGIRASALTAQGRRELELRADELLTEGADVES
jgi:transcriptional regulator with XRE-family HTH domain